MKKQVVLITLVALFVSLFTITAAAQMTTRVTGYAKDIEGKPIVDAQVIMQSVDSNRKYNLKTDKRGEFASLGIQPGSYNFILMKDGKTLFQLNNVPVKLVAGDKDNNIAFDLQKEKAEQAKRGPSEEEKKRIEAVQKENTKIKGLNDKLAAARTAKEAGNFDQAVQILNEAVTMDPNRDIIWAALADANVGAKKYPDAIEAYKKAIALAPNRGEYHNNVGQAYLKNNQIDEAIAEYNKAAELDPTHAGTYYFNLGAVLTNKNKLDEANAAFDKAIAADPTKAEAYYWKGVNLFAKATVDPKTNELKAPEGTAENLNKYLELQPEGQFAQASKDLLASMGAKVQTSFGERKKTKK